MTFEIAKRRSTPVTAAIVGKSGTGKTYSALLLARGMAGDSGKICLIDTEGGRSSMYADDPDIGGFFSQDLEPPYSSDRYLEKVQEALNFGADVIIIDSASHEHEGEGGMLWQAEKARADYESQYPGRRASANIWVGPKTSHNRFVRFAVGCKAHIIFCLRQKETIDMESLKNKNKPATTMLAPVCEWQLLYEMMVVAELSQDHTAKFTKIPKPLADIAHKKGIITKDMGRFLANAAAIGERKTQQVSDIGDAAMSDQAGPPTPDDGFSPPSHRGGPADWRKQKIVFSFPIIDDLADKVIEQAQVQRLNEEAMNWVRDGAQALKDGTWQEWRKRNGSEALPESHPYLQQLGMIHLGMINKYHSTAEMARMRQNDGP